MKRKVLLTAFVTLLSTTFLFAQLTSLKGKVTDESGAALENASVVLKEKGTGVKSDSLGNFSIKIPDDGKKHTIIISYTGYNDQKLEVSNASANLSIKLKLAAAKEGDEIIMVGYVPIKKKDLNAAATQVGASQLKDIPLIDAQQAITGKATGVNVTTTQGAPGAEVKIAVRGGGSVTQDNSPIYVVDGVQVENALQVLSPSDIQSIDILKDAASTAIYGARGANGVFIITTKSGKAGKTIVTYNGSVGFKELSKKLDVLKPYDFVLYQYEASRNATDSSTFAKTWGATWDTLAEWRNAPFIDWQDKVFGKTAFNTSHNLGISGGNKQTTFNLSYTYNKEDGIMLYSGLERNLINFKIKHDINDKLEVGFSYRLTSQRIDGSGTSESSSTTVSKLRNSIQYLPVNNTRVVPSLDDPNLDLTTASGIIQPVILAYQDYQKKYLDGSSVNGYINYKINKRFTFRTNIGYDSKETVTNHFLGPITIDARRIGGFPIASKQTENSNSFNINSVLSYSKKKILKHHNVDALIGTEIYELRLKSLYIETDGYDPAITPDKALATLGNPSATYTASGGTQPPSSSLVQPPARTASFFSRLNYSYDDKYAATFSIRYDGSSLFAPEAQYQWALFPSASFSWRIMRENFMAKAPSWLSDAKLRFSHGVAGNNRVPYYVYKQMLSASGSSTGVLTTSQYQANPYLKWETTTSDNFGLDVSFFKSRVNLVVDYYENKVTDLILTQKVNTPGFLYQYRNIGSTTNKGIEFQVSAVVVDKKQFNWTTNFNISFNKNKVTDLGTEQQRTTSSGWQGSDGIDDYMLAVGQPVGTMYGYITDGFYKVSDFTYNATTKTYTLDPTKAPNQVAVFDAPQPGTIKLKDISGPSGVPDGVVNALDRTIIGSSQPDFFGGLNNQLTYKNFDFSIFLNWSYGGQEYNANRIQLSAAPSLYKNVNLLSEMENRWMTVNASGQVVTDPVELADLNKNASIWRPVTNNRNYLHSWAIEDRSFLRINNISFGYNFAPSVIKKLGITKLRAYATVNNVAVITGYTGYDPETSISKNQLAPNLDYSAYPRSRTYQFGVNVIF